MLIELDTHFHSVASTHAYSTVKEIAHSALENGIKGFAMTDHAPAMPDSPHIWHFRNLKVIPDYIEGMRVIKGVEANITDLEGHIDMTDFDLEFVDWVIASFHSVVVDNKSCEDFSDAYINVAKNNPYVDVIGHPGSLGFGFQKEKVLKVFKEYDKLVEINESTILHKRDGIERNLEILKICKKYEIPVVVNSDGHYCDIVGNVSNAEKMIEELNFPKELVVNSCAEKIYERIKAKRPGFAMR